MAQLSVVWPLLKESVAHNFRLKFFALCFSIGLFAYSHGQGDDRQQTVPFDLISHLPPEAARRALVTTLPVAIRVTLKGPARSIDRVSQNAAPLDIDLRRGVEEEITFDKTLLKLPRDVSVLSIDPPRINLEWQDVIERVVPLQASITGQPAEGFVVKGEPVVSPDKLTAVGPSVRVEVVQFVRLAPFDVTGLGEGVYRRRVALDPPPDRVRFQGAHGTAAESANVTLTVTRRMSEMKFTSRPVSVVGVPVGFSTPASVDVTVVGPPEVVRSLRAEQIVPRADLSTLPGFNAKENKRGSRIIKLSVDLANADVEIQPPTVSVRW